MYFVHSGLEVSREGDAANYFLYDIVPKHGKDKHNRDSEGPQPPFLAELESMEKPPPDYD